MLIHAVFSLSFGKWLSRELEANKNLFVSKILQLQTAAMAYQLQVGIIPSWMFCGIISY